MCICCGGSQTTKRFEAQLQHHNLCLDQQQPLSKLFAKASFYSLQTISSDSKFGSQQFTRTLELSWTCVRECVRPAVGSMAQTTLTAHIFEVWHRVENMHAKNQTMQNFKYRAKNVCEDQIIKTQMPACGIGHSNAVKVHVRNAIYSCTEQTLPLTSAPSALEFEKEALSALDAGGFP